MGFKKINERVASVLEKRGWSEPIEQQKPFFSAVKSGRHIVYEGNRGSGKFNGFNDCRHAPLKNGTSGR